MMYLWFILFVPSARLIWPPAHDVSLEDNDTFEIIDTFDEEEMQDVYDEESEMIRMGLLEKETTESGDFYRLHQVAERRNKEVSKEDKKLRYKYKREFNPEMLEPRPWKASYIDEKGGEHKNKRAFDVNTNYDYNTYEIEFKKNLEKRENLSSTLNATDVAEDETLKDAAGTLIDFKKPINCTAEENRGIGIGALECLWEDQSTDHKAVKVLKKIGKIIVVWTTVYLAIAIPLWCWCCCCFRCKFCFPKARIDEVKKYLTENPIGVYHDEDGAEIKYEPTNYEKYAQKKLERAIRKL
ncbi:unnamed protein product [Brassicogethes aeneus]|uniref:Uncharacterized protein n=1 Tax=Brassicogethes aeneus TaxID=1431903 RepID=A0A9P0B065_BRAAE|nr:unnamed protein product [Brassicogethes aeneus]